MRVPLSIENPEQRPASPDTLTQGMSVMATWTATNAMPARPGERHSWPGDIRELEVFIARPTGRLARSTVYNKMKDY
jgi:hypothetical protein